jgi:LPS-assembly lipoprotein
MWSSERKTGRQDWRLAVIALALPLCGCFAPMYGEAFHPGLADEMRAIAIAPIKDRIGHYLGDDLAADLNGTGETPEPKYRLTVAVTVGIASPTVTSQLQVANAATETGTATFTLTPAGGGTTLFTGVAAATAVYDRTEDRFANLRAQRDAEIRMAKSLSQEIGLRVAAYLGGPK